MRASLPLPAPTPSALHPLDQDRKAEWDRLYAALQGGQAIMTIATADREKMDPSWEAKLGLVPAHAYAVLDMTETLGKRLCLVKNPWTHQRCVRVACRGGGGSRRVVARAVHAVRGESCSQPLRWSRGGGGSGPGWGGGTGIPNG